VARLNRLTEVAPCGIHLMALLENTGIQPGARDMEELMI
jgi:hypothetical protein